MLQGSGLTGIMEIGCDDSHYWNTALDGYRLFSRGRTGQGEDGVALYVTAAGMRELCLGMEGEPAWSL